MSESNIQNLNPDGNIENTDSGKLNGKLDSIDSKAGYPEAEDFKLADREYSFLLAKRLFEEHAKFVGEAGDLHFSDFGVPVDKYNRPLVNLRPHSTGVIRSQLGIKLIDEPGDRRILVAITTQERGKTFQLPVYSRDRVRGRLPEPHDESVYMGFVAEVDITNNTSRFFASVEDFASGEQKLSQFEIPCPKGLQPGDPEPADLFIKSCMKAVSEKEPSDPAAQTS